MNADSSSTLDQTAGRQDTGGHDIDQTFQQTLHLLAVAALSTEGTAEHGDRIVTGSLAEFDAGQLLKTLGHCRQFVGVLDGPIGDLLTWTALVNGTPLHSMPTLTGWHMSWVAERLTRAYMQHIDYLVPRLHGLSSDQLQTLMDEFDGEIWSITRRLLVKALACEDNWIRSSTGQFRNQHARQLFELLVDSWDLPRIWERAVTVVRVLTAKTQELTSQREGQ